MSVVAAPSGLPTAAALVDGWNRAALVTAAVSLVGAVAVLYVGRRPAAMEATPATQSPLRADAA